MKWGQGKSLALSATRSGAVPLGLLGSALLLTGGCRITAPAAAALPSAQPGHVTPWSETSPDRVVADLPQRRAAAHEPVPDDGEGLELTIAESVLRAFENNPAFQIERLQTVLRQTAVDRERAAFDPVVSASFSLDLSDRENTIDTARITAADGDSRRIGSQIGVEQVFAPGTRLSLSGAADRVSPHAGDDVFQVRHGARLSQPLLRDAGVGVQRVRLRQAQLDVVISMHEFRAAAESLVARVEHAAWQLILAERRIAIVEESLRLSEAQRDEVMERIRIGRLAEIEHAAVEAEVAQRREDLINARGQLDLSRLVVIQYIGAGTDADWERAVRFADEPEATDDALWPLEVHVAHALQQRPDLLETRLRIERGDLDVMQTRNGRLPRLDAFVALGYSGYADTLAHAHRDAERRERGVEAGLRFEQALRGRRADADFRAAVVSRQQAEESLRNLVNLVQTEVRAAYIEVQRSLQQIEATRATRVLREAVHQAETEKLRVGASTALWVAQTQRDLMAARIAEIEARVGTLTARLELYRVDGSLLDRRGIDFP